MRYAAGLVIVLVFLGGCRSLGAGGRSDREYWEERAAVHGVRGAGNLGHSETALDSVTRYQIDVLFPILRRHRHGDEAVVLDFGSGPGRFTPALAELIAGRAIGVDIVQRYLDLAPRAEMVEYRLIEDGRIPLPDRSVDVVWIALVLTAITDEADLRMAVSEVERVLRDDGLIFLVENTHQRPDLPHLSYRPPEFYASVFPSVPLRREGEYFDLGERISILAGRKEARGAGN